MKDLEDSERGNVRMYPGGRTVPIDRDGADAIPTGRRQHRSGLLYHARYDGCEPATWDHVVAPPAGGGGKSIRYELGGKDGEAPTVVDVHYDPAIEPRLFGITEQIIALHKGVREGEPMVGGMVGAWDHLRRDGFRGRFYVPQGGAAARQRVSSCVELGGRAFDTHFRGRGVGWEEMLQEQRRLWPNGTPWWPQHWDASWNLGNAMHCDADGARSYAVWLSEKQYQGASGDWWLLFPMHSLAIALAHGTWISWDGRCQPHCTAVPSVAEGDRLLSLFCSLPANLLKVQERSLIGRSELHMRSELPEALRGRALFESLHEGQEVMYRYTKPLAEAKAKAMGRKARREWGSNNTRFVKARVVSISDTHACLRDLSSGQVTFFSILEVSNRVVIPES